jgi:hypothetical protein
MKKLVIALAVSAAALVGGSAASAASNGVKAKADRGVSQSTDISSQHRHHHGMVTGIITGGTVIIVRTTGTAIIAGTAISGRTATTAAGRASPSALAAADIAAGRPQSPQRCGLFSFWNR